MVRWGIIGCGDVTEVKSGPGFQKADGSRLVAVMRRNGALASDYAKRHGVPRWYDDASRLIADPDVDAVYVATPPDTHAAYALAAAAAGKPAYVEKPMARHAPECDRMVEAFSRAGLPLFVAFYRRRLPVFLKVKELVDSGALGHVTGASYRIAEPHHLKGSMWRVDAAVAGAGHFLDVGSHALDLLDYFLGPLTHVTGSASNVRSSYSVEDTVSLRVLAAGGVQGHMECDFASDSRDDTMTITGTDGKATFRVFSSAPLRVEGAGGAREYDLPFPPHVARPLIQSIVDDLLGLGKCPSTGDSARRTSRVMDQALAAYYGGRDDEFWGRPGTWPGRRGRPGRNSRLFQA